MSEYITKGITSTVVKGFKLENGAPIPCEVTFEGALTTERATAKAKGMLVASVEQVRKYYRLSRDVAMEHVTTERADKSDIQLGETGTSVYALRLITKEVQDEDGNTVTVLTPNTKAVRFEFDAPMTEQRAFGAARRAASKAGYDILPYASDQQRTAYFLSRDTFFELAEPVKAEAVSEDDSETEDSAE